MDSPLLCFQNSFHYICCFQSQRLRVSLLLCILQLSIWHNAMAAGANARPKVKLVGSAARVVCTDQSFAWVKFYSAFIQLECSDRRQGGLGQSLSPVSSRPRFKWMKVTAKPPQLGNRLGFFKELTVSSSSTLDEIVGLFPFFLPKMGLFLLLYFCKKKWPG